MDGTEAIASRGARDLFLTRKNENVAGLA